MSEIFLCGGAADATVLSNVFIDEYLKDAVQKLGVLSDANKKRQIRVFDLKEILWAFEKDGNFGHGRPL